MSYVSFQMVIYSALYAFLLLISTSLVAEKARQFRRGVVEVTHESRTPRTTRRTFVDTCEYYDSNSPCSNVEAAVVCIIHRNIRPRMRTPILFEVNK